MTGHRPSTGTSPMLDPASGNDAHIDGCLHRHWLFQKSNVASSKVVQGRCDIVLTAASDEYANTTTDVKNEYP